MQTREQKEIERLRRLLKQTADCLEDVATKEVWGWDWEAVLSEAREALEDTCEGAAAS
jgi:hypothetical protein